MLSALKKLGEKLNATEEQFLQTYSSESLKKFEQVSGEIGKYVTIMLQRGLVITMSVKAKYCLLRYKICILTITKQYTSELVISIVWIY